MRLRSDPDFTLTETTKIPRARISYLLIPVSGILSLFLFIHLSSYWKGGQPEAAVKPDLHRYQAERKVPIDRFGKGGSQVATMAPAPLVYPARAKHTATVIFAHVSLAAPPPPHQQIAFQGFFTLTCYLFDHASCPTFRSTITLIRITPGLLLFFPVVTAVLHYYRRVWEIRERDGLS